MTDLEIQPHPVKLISAPEDLLPVVLSASSQAGTERFGIGAILCLSGLGIAAIATILAFFGTGFLLLSGRPTPIARSEPPAIVTTKALSAPAMHAETTPAALPAGGREIAGPPDKGEIASAPIAPLSKMPASSVSENKTAPIPLAPGPGSGVAGAAAGPATNGVLASAVPAVAPQQRQTNPMTVSSAAPSVRAEPAPSPPGEGEADVTKGPTPMPPLPAAEIKALLVQGDNAFRRGDLATARLLYRRAYEAGDGRGALGIGASYDPLFLRQFRLWTQISDPEEARLWYARARNLGAPQAADRLKRLSAKTR